MQKREGLPASITEQRRFFQMRGSSKDDTPAGWNNPEKWLELDDIPDDKPFGFVAGTGSNYLFIDGDHVFNDAGKYVNAFIEGVCNRIFSAGKTYYEWSVSKYGFHLLCDLGDFSEAFEPVSNTADEIIIDMNPDEYRKLPEDQRDEIPKIELFYHVNGRYILLTGNNNEVVEVAKDEAAAAIFRECLAIREEQHKKHRGKEPAKEAPESAASEAKKREVTEALAYISAADYETWIHVGIALYRSGFDFAVWDEWSQWANKRAGVRYPDYDEKETAAKWKSFISSRSRWNLGTIFHLAKNAGWEQPVPAGLPVLESAADFMRRDIPPLKHIVKGLITEGVGIVAAAQKMGKTWFCLQLAGAVAQGRPFLGRETSKGSVIYFDLEQAEQLRQERLRILMPEGAPENLYLASEAPAIGDGFEAMLRSYLQQVAGVQLVIIDVMDMVADDQKKNEAPKKHAYRNISALKPIARDFHIAILCVMHFRKVKDKDDYMSNVSGSNGWTAAADYCLGIDRKRGEKGAALQSDGRTAKAVSMRIVQDEVTMSWRAEGSLEEIQRRREKADFESHAITRAVIAAVDEGGGQWTGTSVQLLASNIFSGSGDVAETARGITGYINNHLELFRRLLQIEIYNRNERNNKTAEWVMRRQK